MKHKPRKSKRRRLKVERSSSASARQGRLDRDRRDRNAPDGCTEESVPVGQLVAALASSGLKSSSKRRSRTAGGESIPTSTEEKENATSSIDDEVVRLGHEGSSDQHLNDHKQVQCDLVSNVAVNVEDDLRDVEGKAAPHLVAIIESLLFAAPKPLTVKELHRLLQETTVHQIQLAIKHLIAVRKDSGIVVARAGGGFVLTTHPQHAKWVQQMLQAKPARLTRAQLECLAIVSYRQPVTRPEIDHVRGVDSGAALKTLMERDLIQIVGKKDEPGRPMLYGTTLHFLEFFNLMSLRDLPDLREFCELSDGTKELLRNKLGPDEAEMLGQEVLEYSLNSNTTDTEASLEPSDVEPSASQEDALTEEICDSN